MNRNDTVAQLTCDAILQNPITVKVKGREYKVAPPSTATIIEVSKYIAKIPDIKAEKDGNVLMEVLATAKDCKSFGDIVAILILGKKNLITREKRFFGLISRERNNQKVLAEELLETLSPAELNGLMLEIFKTLNVDFFFSISIFLKEINLLRRTKETETTASGQKSLQSQQSTN